jgi:hypothetical protein
MFIRFARPLPCLASLALFSLLATPGPASAAPLVLAGTVHFDVFYDGEVGAAPGVPIPPSPLTGSGSFRFVGEDLLDFRFEFLGATFNDADFQCGGCDPADEEGEFSFDLDYGAGYLSWRSDDGNCGFRFDDVAGLSGASTCEDGDLGMPLDGDFRVVPEPSGLALAALGLLLVSTMRPRPWPPAPITRTPRS